MLLLALGLIVGSFLNALIWRLNDDKAPKFWQGRSICPNCKHQLSWADNIPLLSFLFLKGKCRYCHQKISWQYPIVELITASVFFLTGWNPVMWVLGSVFIVIFFSDLKYGLIPDEMVLVGCIAAGFSNFIYGLATCLLFLSIFLITRQKGIGFGDVKLALLMGLLLGWPKIGVALWSAFILGGIAVLILLALRRTKLSATIPLGPFLVIGTLVAALWSENILAVIR